MLTALLASASAAAAAAPLPPNKPWVVDYAETFCTASRQYGEAADPLTLVLRPSPEGNVLQLFLIRSGKEAPAEHVPLTLDFAGRTLKASALVYGVKKSGRRMLLASLGGDAAADIGRTQTVTLRGRGIDYAFAVPDIGKVMTALATCNADLRTVWNMTAEKMATIATPASTVGNLRNVLDRSDYPAQALREEDTGTARVLLLVNEQGKVSDCLLQQTSGNASLDAMTCIRLVQRGRFHPALDAAGKPMKSATTQAVSWRIGGAF